MSPILLIYDQKEESLWRDGFYAAIKLLEKEQTVIWHNVLSGKPLPEAGSYGTVLVRGDWGGKSDLASRSLEGTKGIYLCGNSRPPLDPLDYNVVFYESPWQEKAFEHPNKVHAFGINSDIFYPSPNKAIIDVLGVGALALWKRWDKFCTVPGTRLVVGEYQRENEQESLAIAQTLLRSGVGVMPSVPPETLRELYASSGIVYIPANLNGGGERAIMEARHCGAMTWIADDNPKLEWFQEAPLWDQHYLLQQLKKGLHVS
jgi:hypothetical protein